MKARTINICLAVLLIAASYVWGNRSVVHADAFRTYTAPKGWGHLVGGNDKALVFEDSAGVIRIVNPFEAQVMETVNRQ
jgi:hypothetical protein